jgi:hypothetical protein
MLWDEKTSGQAVSMADRRENEYEATVKRKNSNDNNKRDSDRLPSVLTMQSAELLQAILWAL